MAELHADSTTIPTLTTERLVLRAYVFDDAPTVQRLAGAPEVAETTLNIPHPYPDGAAEEWISKHAPAFAEGKAADWAITLADTGELLGSIGLIFDEVHRRAEMGYWVAAPHWGKGYCTEAAKRVLNYGFNERGLLRVCAHHFGSNPASGRIMQKIGMKYEGTLRHHIKKWDRYEDAVWYGILRDEFDSTNNR